MEILRREKKSISDIFYQHTGIDLSDKRDTFFTTRMKRLLVSSDCDSITSYILKVEKDPKTLQEFLDRMTTHETYFFRTPRIWNSLVPYLKEFKGDRFKAWSAACSTGEEVYSLGMLCDKHLKNKSWKIFGSDVSKMSVQTAMSAKYSGRVINKLREHDKVLLDEYFRADDKDLFYTMKPSFLSNTNFFVHNLTRAYATKNQFDVIFLRNVLIYFKDDERKSILENVFNNLKPGGLLILGESESLVHKAESFENIAPFIYKRLKDLNE